MKEEKDSNAKDKISSRETDVTKKRKEKKNG